MTLLRNTLGLALLITTAMALPRTLCAQQVVIPAQINDVVTRVPISVPQQPASGTGASVSLFDREIIVNGTYGPNFSLCAKRSNIGSADNYLDADFLRTSLLSVISGRSAAQLQTLIQQIQSETDRRRRFALIFAVVATDMAKLAELSGGFSTGGSSTTGPGSSRAAWERLRMGQEVQIPGPACYTVAQVDQVNAQALGVIQAVAQALAPAPAQATQKPVAPGIGIGIQKPQ